MNRVENLVVGGGPAGLAAAYELSKVGREVLVLEADDDVGGLSRTCTYRGYRFDIGGHRFFTKVDYVRKLWEEILGEDFLTRPRLSRIYYRGKLFDYPLRPMNALVGLGPVESLRVVLSYGRSFFFPHIPERNFAEWVSNRFGRRLFEIFFQTYTEKVWGMPCTEISADWAAQRIKNLDLATALRNALLGGSSKRNGRIITTLIDSFQYPRYGPGQMWTRCRDLLEQRGSRVLTGTRIERLLHDGQRVTEAVVRNGTGPRVIGADRVITSMPLQELVHSFDPPPPAEVVAAADRLRYRDFLTVALIVDRADLFPDNWIYIHSSEVRVGRIQNYKNWSPDMVPDQAMTALGLEYFVQEGDDLWSLSDDELVTLGRAECDRLGLAPADAVLDGTVLRVRKAYPVYDGEYRRAVAVIREWLGTLENLESIGRNGQHRYNNQDHSMMTGVYAARNATGGDHDTWSVNVEEEYHEERGGERGDRLVPRQALEPGYQAVLDLTFARYDPVALAAACAVVMGLGLFLAAVLVLVVGPPGGSTPSILGRHIFGPQATFWGALLGLLEAGALGWSFGYLLARLINALIAREERWLQHRVDAIREMQVIEEGPA